jgi:hypothetical protein
MMLVETQLVRAMERAAASAPDAPGDLLGRVEAGYRRRRRRTGVAVGVLSVLALVGASAGLARAELDRPSRTRPAKVVSVPPSVSPSVSPWDRLTQARPPAVATVGPAQAVWPEAVRPIPAKAPGGGTYRPITALDTHRLLLAVESGFEQVSALRVYDQRNGDSALVANLAAPAGMSSYRPSNFAVGDGMVGWMAAGTRTGGGAVSEFWVVPLGGGVPRLVHSGPELHMTSLTLASGTLYWAAIDGSGIYRLPVSGGSPTPVPDTSGLQITRWPWAVPASPMGMIPTGRQSTEIRNLVTGERRSAQVRPEMSPRMVCEPDVCVGSSRLGENMVQAFDGSWSVPSDRVVAPRRVLRGRFVVGSLALPSGQSGAAPGVIWDLRTGKVATYGDLNTGASAANKTNAYSGAGSWDQPDPLVWWPDSGNSNRLMVLDPQLIS